MIVLKGTDRPEVQGLVATIGFFDGVHLGHRFLIEELKRIATEKGLPSAVITFPVHPRAVLQPGYHPNLLNTLEEKLTQLETTGVDYCILLDFTLELSRFSAKEFIADVLHERYHVKTLLIGYDHRFGHDRKDGFDQYVAYGRTCGLEVLKATPFYADSVTVSSSGIRDLLLSGAVQEVTKLLSYPYSLTGHIVDGYKVGRKLGFPTANIRVDDPDKIIPAIGVYAVWVYVEGGRHKGMLYIGDRPTLQNGSEITMEVNILDFNKNIYNNQITVSFISYIRGDIKFESLEELIDQLVKDRDTVSGVLDVLN